MKRERYMRKVLCFMVLLPLLTSLALGQSNIYRFPGQIQAQTGSLSLPSYSFIDDPNTGMYRVGADRLNFVTGGITGIDIQNTFVQIANPLFIGNGTNSNPALSFTADQDSGLYRIGADNLGISVGGVKKLDIASTGLTVTGTLRSERAATQDAVIVAGRNGGTSSYAVTVTPTTLTGSRTLTLANGDTTLVAGTMAPTASPVFTTQITTPIVYGSSAASGSLELTSTSDATKGAVNIGAAGGIAKFEAAAATINVPLTMGTVATRTTDIHTVFGLFLFENSRDAYRNTTNPTIHSTSSGGAGVYAEAGHLILEPRLSGATRDVIVMGSGEVPVARFNGGGAVTLGPDTGAAPTHTFYTGTASVNGQVAITGPEITTNDRFRSFFIESGAQAAGVRVVKHADIANAHAALTLSTINIWNVGGADGWYAGSSYTLIGRTTAGIGIVKFTTTSVSDSRSKKNVDFLTTGLNTLAHIQPIVFDYRDGYDEDKENRAGFVAQQVREHYPQAVRDAGFTVEGEENILKLDDTALIALAYKAIQEQQVMIAALEARLAALENK
jgi:hypothetical protein